VFLAPISFNVDDPSRPTVYGDGLQRAIISEPAHFSVDTKKIKGDVKVIVIKIIFNLVSVLNLKLFIMKHSKVVFCYISIFS